MSTNCVNNIARNGVKGIFNSKAGELLLRQVKRIPYIDAADGALLRDKKTSDAIKASMSPVVKKVEIENCQTVLETEINKDENAGIKEDFNKIKKSLDYSKMPVYSKDKLQEVIKNLKNRRKWLDAISNLINPKLKDLLFKNIENNKNILTCFGISTKKGKKVNQLPTFNEAVFHYTAQKQYKDYGAFINAYNVNILPLKEFDNNQKTFNLIKQEFIQNTQQTGQYYGQIQVTENFQADEYKIDSLATWYKKIEELEKSNSYKDKIILNDIYKYINDSVKEDRELIKNAKEKHIPNAYPKNIIPFFDEKLFEKALNMNGNQSIMIKYEQCYRDNIIEKYSLLKDENNNATQNGEFFYQLDMNKRRIDTSFERHLNELQFISPNSWCTHSIQGFMHKYAKHYYIILDKNKKVKFGGDYTTEEVEWSNFKRNRMESSTEDNNQKFSLKMVKQILSLLKSQNVEIPFAPEHSDLRYLLAKAIIKEKGMENLKKEYKAISTEFNLPALDKDTFISILRINTKNYIEDNNTLISMEQFKFLMDALNIDGEIDKFNEKQLKMINVKRYFEKNYPSELTLNDINIKLEEFGYTPIDLTNEEERNETIYTIANVVIDADLSKRDYINYKKVYQVVKQIGLTSDKENNDENSFLANLYNILKSYYITYLKFNINTICQNLDLGRKIKISELTKKLNDLGFITDDLDDTVFKYASPCYVDFEWDEEKIESEIVNETNVDNNNEDNDDFEIDFAKLDKLPANPDDLPDIDNLFNIGDIPDLLNLDNLSNPDDLPELDDLHK